jgi:DNA-binding MarR family transcriptional regulator
MSRSASSVGAEGGLLSDAVVLFACRLKGLNTAELMIYQLVEKELNMGALLLYGLRDVPVAHSLILCASGIWVRDLRTRSNLSQQQVTKIVKTLMSKKLIKAEKSTAAKNKKVYMLYDLE